MVSMECPVCYTCNANCHLVCGHSFCRDCVKEWWMKSSECNCPMCRKPLYFKGLYSKQKEWEEEREEKILQSAYSTLFDELLSSIEEFGIEEDPEFAMVAILSFEERFKKFTKCGLSSSEETIVELVGNSIYDIITEYQYDMYCDDPVHERVCSKSKNGTERKIKFPSDKDIRTPPTELYELIVVF